MIIPPCVLTIAGTDPSGGAGIQADIKTISATGSYAASVVTALVAQNTQGVQAIHSIPATFVKTQLHSVFDDLTIHAVKIGMLQNKEIIETAASALQEFKPRQVVLDPVMVAKDGSVLLECKALDALKKLLFPLATLITPNLPETEKILNHSIITETDMEQAAKELGQQFKTNILIKGGHFEGQTSSDVLYFHPKQSLHWFSSQRIFTKNTHGTGCTLSSAIASYLAQKHSLIESIHLAKHYLTQAIQSGSQLEIGHGQGPVDHFYFLR